MDVPYMESSMARAQFECFLTDACVKNIQISWTGLNLKEVSIVQC